jgi:membrane-bound lytic murein transglycosylase
MSVDVEIYMNNIIKFFKENPNDLHNLIPKNKEDEFYKKLME